LEEAVNTEDQLQRLCEEQRAEIKRLRDIGNQMLAALLAQAERDAERLREDLAALESALCAQKSEKS
jgi:hypothetical protein